MARRIRIRVQTHSGSSAENMREIEARAGTNLWFQLRKHGFPIGSSCSGVGVCGACAVRVTPLGNAHTQVTQQAAGSQDTDQRESAVSTETPLESQSKIRNGIGTDKRLACLVRLWGDVLVEDLPV